MKNNIKYFIVFPQIFIKHLPRVKLGARCERHEDKSAVIPAPGGLGAEGGEGPAHSSVAGAGSRCAWCCDNRTDAIVGFAQAGQEWRLQRGKGTFPWTWENG